ncbi:MAG TPA: hypothetical protein VGM54_05590 [Chthoniobacter sp.]|jgi:hypothetical protein
MSTVVEIERAIERLPTEQPEELRRWKDSHFPKGRDESDATGNFAAFDAWLASSTGLAKGLLTTDDRMRETRGED